MSANLNAPALTGGQANPETTTNDAIGALDAAVTETVVVDVTADVTMTSATFRSAIRFSATPVGAGKAITLPAVKRLVYIGNDSATNALLVKRGTTSISVAALGGGFFYVDGTTNGLIQLSSGGGGGGGGTIPHDLHIFQPGKPDNAALLFRFNVVRAFTLPASLTGSVFNAGVAATGSSVFTIKKNGSSIGTITYSAAGTTGAVVFASSVTFAINDIITITGQSTADATLADIAFDFLGSI
jgi:hypothetical protein